MLTGTMRRASQQPAGRPYPVNGAPCVDHGEVTAGMRRTRSAAAKLAMRAAGPGGAAKPKRKRAVRKKGK